MKTGSLAALEVPQEAQTWASFAISRVAVSLCHPDTVAVLDGGCTGARKGQGGEGGGLYRCNPK